MNNFFIHYLVDNPQLYVTWVVVVMFSICLHEMSHAWTASWRGDHLARMAGFMTMNPLKTMGPISLVMLFVVGIAWGAVPVNLQALRTRGNRALVAFAGPAANLALSLLFMTLLGILSYIAHRTGDEASALVEAGALIASVGAAANLFLFFFNMIPLPPFDGFGVLAAYWDGADALRKNLGGAATLILFVMLFSTRIGDYLFATADHLSFGGAGIVHFLLARIFGG